MIHPTWMTKDNFHQKIELKSNEEPLNYRQFGIKAYDETEAENQEYVER